MKLSTISHGPGNASQPQRGVLLERVHRGKQNRTPSVVPRDQIHCIGGDRRKLQQTCHYKHSFPEGAVFMADNCTADVAQKRNMGELPRCARPFPLAFDSSLFGYAPPVIWIQPFTSAWTEVVCYSCRLMASFYRPRLPRVLDIYDTIEELTAISRFIVLSFCSHPFLFKN